MSAPPARKPLPPRTSRTNGTIQIRYCGESTLSKATSAARVAAPASSTASPPAFRRRAKTTQIAHGDTFHNDRHPDLKIIAAHGGGYLPTHIGRSDHAWSARTDTRGCAHPPSSYLKQLYFDSLVHDPYVLLVAADSDLAALESAPPLRELARLPLIGRRSADEPERFLRGRIPELDVVFRTDDNGTLAALVAGGHGAAIVPRLVVDPRNAEVRMLPVRSLIPPRTIVLAWHRDRYRPPAAEAFVELACELGADYERRSTGRPSASAASTSRRRGR